jgi:hypothetical protein
MPPDIVRGFIFPATADSTSAPVSPVDGSGQEEISERTMEAIAELITVQMR